MARVSKSVKLYQDIQQDPTLKQLNVIVNRTNDIIASMGKSSYFSGITVPNKIDIYNIVQDYKNNPRETTEYITNIYGTLSNIWNQRRDTEYINDVVGIAKTQQGYIKTLTVAINTSITRSEQASKPRILSKKAQRILIAGDVQMLMNITGKSEKEVLNFIDLWYQNPKVSKGMLLKDFAKAVYQREYAGAGSSISWGSPPPFIYEIEELLESELDITPAYNDDYEQLSYDVEQNMDQALYDAWINLFR